MRIENFKISEEQAKQFAAELYYGSDFVSEVKQCIEAHRDEYEQFLKERQKSKQAA